MGERQKIAIARALYRCPQLLILDEPTSSIDARSEVEIFEHLLTAPHRHSTILISHRYHTLMAADQIAVVHNGRIAEMETVLTDCLAYMENREDVVDGSYGVPEANKEMRLAMAIREVLGERP